MVAKGSDSNSDRELAKTALTEQDLLLGKKACKRVSIICVSAIIVCAVIAVFVFISVPWDSKMPYIGKYNRSGAGIPMQIALLPALVVLFGFYRSGRKPDAHHMGKGSRGVTYIVGTGMIVACVFFQVIFAESILTESGYFPG